MLSIVPRADLADRTVVEDLVLDALRTGRPVPAPVAAAYWAFAEEDLPGGFDDVLAIARGDVPVATEFDCNDFDGGTLDEDRLADLEAGASPTEDERRRWQGAWIAKAFKIDDADVAGAVCVLPLGIEVGPVAAAILHGWEHHGYRITRIGFFRNRAAAYDAMRGGFVLSCDAEHDA